MLSRLVSFTAFAIIVTRAVGSQEERELSGKNQPQPVGGFGQAGASGSANANAIGQGFGPFG
eukprot:CAMPEP_0118695168 /NCGR_PEP_ID=MMETSP0800-20121206/13018_1 /TAXON_ID=210618 ORGANISM="Striatella unipunctata, Strain CCMP2910" /NCGR_SAMPLE_ID=MMETSP0800 /ASSEMBLY_ACC=CAM_ASM_000638 /LENGTH=61 /DNA_ID=CAMNT_0006593893 /DNA_START=60 /DNA_END=241 /DNA_ORIENTATION=+